MAPKFNNKGKDEDLGDSKSDKQKVHWTMFNKMLFLDLVFKQKTKGKYDM